MDLNSSQQAEALHEEPQPPRSALEGQTGALALSGVGGVIWTIGEHDAWRKEEEEEVKYESLTTPQPPKREQVRQLHPVYTLWTTRTVWTTGERDARTREAEEAEEEEETDDDRLKSSNRSLYQALSD